MRNKYKDKRYLNASIYNYEQFFNNSIDPMLSENNVIDYLNTIVNGAITKNAYLRTPVFGLMVPRAYEILNTARTKGTIPSLETSSFRNRFYRTGTTNQSSSIRRNYFTKMATMYVASSAMTNMIDSDSFRNILYRDQSVSDYASDIGTILYKNVIPTVASLSLIKNLGNINTAIKESFPNIAKSNVFSPLVTKIKEIPKTIDTGLQTFAQNKLTLKSGEVNAYREKIIGPNATNILQLKNASNGLYGAKTSPFKKVPVDRQIKANVSNMIEEIISETNAKAKIQDPRNWFKRTFSNITGIDKPIIGERKLTKSETKYIRQIGKNIWRSSSDTGLAQATTTSISNATPSGSVLESMKRNISTNLTDLIDYEKTMKTKKWNSMFVTLGRNAYFGGLVASSMAHYIEDNRKANNFVQGILSEMTSGYRKINTFGNGMPSFEMSSEAAMSERQRAISAIQNSHLNARVYIGQEAKLRFQNEGF